MFKKRGKKAGILLTIFQLIIIAIISLFMLKSVLDLKNNRVLEKNFIARDLALITSSLYAAPGNVTYVYDQDLATDEYFITFEKNFIKIWDPKGRVVGYYYPGDKEFSVIYVKDLQIPKGKNLQFVKENKKIEIKND